jgi:hypothetical protein
MICLNKRISWNLIIAKNRYALGWLERVVLVKEDAPGPAQ